MTVAEALYARLRAALPEQVHVLRPEEIQKINAGGKPNQPAGLASYLREYPQGWVQVEEPLPISADPVTARYWVAVATLGASAAEVAALALLVRRALTGTPRDPGPHSQATPAEPTQPAPGVWMVRPTYQVLTVDGTPTA